ncbi:MAG: hypothetical protein JKP92_03190 [Alphaproteobacteria bacterium]|jgi:hypothetical protein|nr:hypothetical protein [Alphaproteobacteria bacterium]
MPTLMPRDDDNTPIPAVTLKPGGAHEIAVTAGASARNATPFGAGTRVVSLYATQPVYIRLGDAAVTADTMDHFFPAGVYYDVAISNVKTTHYAHIAARAVADAGMLYISEKE